MIVNRFAHLTIATAMGITSCVQPVPAPVPTDPVKATATPAKPATAPSAEKPKAPRMNGRGKVTSISLTEFFALQQTGEVLILDARPGYFYALGHIPGALSLPKVNGDKEIEKRQPEIKAAIAANKPIVIYCTNTLCADARTLARHLAEFGYSSSVLSGGWDSWRESGMPTE
jgi:rhodanese-related sulfurtransferase